MIRIDEKRTEDALKEALEKEGKYKKITSSTGTTEGITGPDIVLDDSVYVEVKGYSDKPPKRRIDFWMGLIEALSRLRENHEKIVLAMPTQFKKGLPQRFNYAKKLFKVLACNYPNLEFWFVDVSNKTYETCKIGDFVKKEGKL